MCIGIWNNWLRVYTIWNNSNSFLFRPFNKTDLLSFSICLLFFEFTELLKSSFYCALRWSRGEWITLTVDPTVRRERDVHVDDTNIRAVYIQIQCVIQHTSVDQYASVYVRCTLRRRWMLHARAPCVCNGYKARCRSTPNIYTSIHLCPVENRPWRMSLSAV